MAVKLSPTAYKELKTAIRNYATKGKVEKLLTSIQQTAYKQGYADSYNDASKQIQEAFINAHTSSNPGDNDDGVKLQPEGSELGTSEGLDAVDADSGEGSAESVSGTGIYSDDSAV